MFCMDQPTHVYFRGNPVHPVTRLDMGSPAVMYILLLFPCIIVFRYQIPSADSRHPILAVASR